MTCNYFSHSLVPLVSWEEKYQQAFLNHCFGKDFVTMFFIIADNHGSLSSIQTFWLMSLIAHCLIFITCGVIIIRSIRKDGELVQMTMLHNICECRKTKSLILKQANSTKKEIHLSPLGGKIDLSVRNLILNNQHDHCGWKELIHYIGGEADSWTKRETDADRQQIGWTADQLATDNFKELQIVKPERGSSIFILFGYKLPRRIWAALFQLVNSKLERFN